MDGLRTCPGNVTVALMRREVPEQSVNVLTFSARGVVLGRWREVMLTKRQSLSMIVTGALLFLSFAVIGLGLHNKLSLYKATPFCHHRIVKLSVRERAAQSLASPRESRPPKPSTDYPRTSLLFQADVRHFAHLNLAELTLAIPCSYDSLGPNRLALPPPNLS